MHIIESLIKRHQLILLQMLFWVSLPFLISLFIWAYQYTVFLPGLENQLFNYGEILLRDWKLNLGVLLVGIYGFYFSYFLLIPQFKQPNNWPKSLLFLLLLLLGPALTLYLLTLLSYIISEWQGADLVYWFMEFYMLSSIITLIPFAILGALLRVTQDNQGQREAYLKLKKENLENQFALLKAQMSPHFLFNTINNIDILIEKDPPLASRYLNKLSELLRFMLYRASQDWIRLKDEMYYLEQYLALQKIRSPNPNFVTYHVQGSADDWKIPPMLMIVLVENAFKYVANKKEDKAISIDLEINSSRLIFSCGNLFHPVPNKPNEASGIGLQSLQQRLALIYQNHYLLEIKQTEKEFKVRLEIPNL